MPRFRSSPPPDPPLEGDGLEVYDLTTPEEARTRKQRRRWIVGTLVLLTLAAFAWLGGRPIGHEIKSWQARRAAAGAEKLIDAESWREAQVKVQDALQLRATEPAAVRAAARYLTVMGHPAEADSFWKQLETIRPLTPAEQRDFAIVELGLGNLNGAADRLSRSSPNGDASDPKDWRIKMQLDSRRGLKDEAGKLAHMLLASQASNARERLDAAAVLLDSGAPEDQAESWTAIRQIADNGRASVEGLEALIALSRRSGAALAAAPGSEPPKPPALPAGELAARLEAHPMAHIQHRLLAMDLRLALNPASRAETIQTAMARFNGGDPEDLAGLGAWLYSKYEFAKVLEVIPESKAILSRALFLQHLDTLGAVGRWHDIEDLIQRQKFTLDPMIEQMYLARCSEMQGQAQARDVHWNAALAEGRTNPGKLMTLANYALQNGAISPAEKAYRAAMAADPKAYAPCVALLTLLQRQSRTPEMHELLVGMSKKFPDEDAVRNDCAYTGLLLKLDPSTARDTARDLVRKAPDSMPHRITLALAELRLGHTLSAMDSFGGRGVFDKSQPRQMAVFAATLWETSDESQARRVAATIPRDQLLPEERALIEKITPE